MSGKTKTDFFDYDGFCDKFIPPKTTDDCYTPPAVYQAVKDWVVKEYAVVDGIRLRLVANAQGGTDLQAKVVRGMLLIVR